jgi:hypothetical protein
MATLSSPNVQVSINNQSQYAETFPTTVPLFVLATRESKSNPSGTGIAAGTTESNTVRSVTSQREVLQLLGNPTFVTSGGLQVHGHECNEYGLHALWNFMATSSLAYYVRADIDLDQLLPSSTEPVNPPADGTYWIDSDAVVTGFYRRNAANSAWEALTAAVYTTAPAAGNGSEGDIAFDYSTADGTVKVKTDGTTWADVGSTDLSATSINSRTAATADVWISDTAPLGAGANDYWWKTTASSGGYDLKLSKYRASDATWVEVIPTRSTTEPTDKTSGLVWEDLSTFTDDGQHPLKVANGTAYVALTATVQAAAPTTTAVNGDLWYSEDITDFALYKEVSDEWVAITTTTDADPTATEKVISASAPASPATGAFWVDISGDNLDNFPVIKRYTGSGWEDITSSVSITSTYTAPTLVANGSIWLNLDDPATKCTVKVYDDTYEPVTIASGVKDTWESADGRWKPIAGARFLRKAQRYMISSKLQAALSDTDELKSESILYQLIAAPGYPELYDDMVAVSTAINERAHVIADVPFRMVASGTASGKEVLAADWKTNSASASETGEEGFASASNAVASMYYPHALMANVDGTNIVAPASAYVLPMLVRTDNNSGPWQASIGYANGVINRVSSVGYITDAGAYKVVNLTDGQSDILYNNQINMVKNIYRVGLRNMGNKTVYGGSELTNRVNVSRLVSKIRYEVKQLLLPYLGQPNLAGTWSSVRNTVNRYFAGLSAAGAVEDYAVRCDETLNTADRRARNELWVEVAMIPVTATEFIYVELRIEEPGASI